MKFENAGMKRMCNSDPPDLDLDPHACLNLDQDLAMVQVTKPREVPAILKSQHAPKADLSPGRGGEQIAPRRSRAAGGPAAKRRSPG